MSRQIRDIAHIFGGQILLLCLGLLSAPLMARLLGPEQLGAFSLIMAAVAVIKLVGGGGISSAIIFYAGRGQLSSRVFQKPIWQLVALGVGICLVGVIISFPLLANTEVGEMLNSGTLYFMIMAVIVGMFLFPVQGIIQVNRYFSALAKINIIGRLIIIAGLGILLILHRNSLNAVLWIQIISNVVILGCLWGYLKGNSYKNQQEKQIANRVSSKEFVDYSVKSVGANIVGMLNYRADTFMLAALSSPFQLGIYAVAVLVAEKIWILSNSVAQVNFSYLVTADDNDSLRIRLAMNTAKWTGVVSVIAGGCVALLSPLIPYIFGKQFNASCSILLLLLPGVLSLAVYRILANAIAAIGRPGINAIVGLLALSINLIANYFLIPVYGAVGAAIATSISYSCLLLSCLVFLVVRKNSLAPLVKFDASDWYALKMLLKRKER